MYDEKTLDHHVNFCGITQPNNICKLCDGAFHSPDELSTHLLACVRFICHYCNIPFVHAKALDYHIENSQTSKKFKENKRHDYK